MAEDSKIIRKEDPIAIMPFENKTNELERIADQLRRMYEGPAWHGPALQQILEEITEAQARARPLSNAHSIWELVLHIAAWMRIARERLLRNPRNTAAGSSVPPQEQPVAFPTSGRAPASLALATTETRDYTAEENWPTISGSWADTVVTAEHEYRNLGAAIRAFSEERLDEDAPASEPQTFYVLLHGVVQHIAYHAGQIAILKK